MMTKKSAGKAPAKRKAKTTRTTEVGQSAIRGLKEGLAFLRGEDVPGLVVHEPVDVAAIRAKTGLSQNEFARKFGLPAPTVKAWEYNQRIPDRAAQLYLTVIEYEPEAVERALRKAS